MQEKVPTGPTTLEEMRLTPDEEADLENARKPKPPLGSPLEAKAALSADGPDVDAVPEWAREYLPPTLRIPRGRQVAFTRFKSSWTNAPHVGVPSAWPETQPGVRGEDDKPIVKLVEYPSRIIMLWTISDAEEHQALKAARDERERTLAEQCKRFMRAVDGKIVDWTGNWAKNTDLCSADNVWRELGSKCRDPLLRMYVQMHKLDTGEMADFLLFGMHVSSSAAG
jgi:hypothetical protein